MPPTRSRWRSGIADATVTVTLPLTRMTIELAAGDYPAARAALAGIDTTTHPEPLVYLALLDLAETKAGDALAHARAAAAALPEHSPLRASALGAEGRALVASGREREALPVLERAEAAAGQIGLASANTAAARVARRAREDFVNSRNDAEARAVRVEIGAWLAQQGFPLP